MTYPPQQPGQPGQPGPYGQPGPWGQPGPHSGSFPQGGQPPQQPQQPGYPGQGPTQQFGQPGPYGQPPAFPGGQGGPGGQPPKKKTGLIVGLSIAAVAVIGGVVALILLLSGDDEGKKTAQGNTRSGQGGQPSIEVPGQSAPDPSGSTDSGDTGDSGGSTDDTTEVGQLADDLLGALNSHDEAAFKEIVCNPEKVNMDNLPQEAKFSANGEPTISGETAKIPMTLHYQGKNEDGAFEAEKESAGWCVSGTS